MKSPFLTIAEIAQIERIHLKTAYKRVRLGKIPGAKRHGRSWRIVKTTYAEKRGVKLEELP